MSDARLYEYERLKVDYVEATLDANRRPDNQTSKEADEAEQRLDAFVAALLAEPTPDLLRRPPLQPLMRDADGTVRFRANAIVRLLLDAGPFDMNALALMQFSPSDREQFAQLIGYSVSGFGELSYVSDDAFDAALAAAPSVPIADAHEQEKLNDG